MGSVGDLIVLLESDVEGLRVLYLVLVAKKLSVELNVNDWVLVAIELIELHRESTAHLIFFWIVPSCCLGK